MNKHSFIAKDGRSYSFEMVKFSNSIEVEVTVSPLNGEREYCYYFNLPERFNNKKYFPEDVEKEFKRYVSLINFI